MLNIYIDMDSTIFDYRSQFNKYHHLNTGNDLSHISWDTYHTHRLYGIPDAERYKYLDQENFFKEMSLYPNAKEVINEIKKNFNVYFVTHAVVKNAYKEKLESLLEHFHWFEQDHLIFMKDKHLLKSGVIIDDNPMVIGNALKYHKVIIPSQEWNLEIDHPLRFNPEHEWLNVLNILNNEIKQGIPNG